MAMDYRLNERDEMVLRARFGIGEPTATLKALGERMEISGPRVAQIERRALKKLRWNYPHRNPTDLAGMLAEHFNV